MHGQRLALTLFIPVDYSTHFDTISMELFILHFKVFFLIFYKMMYSVPKNCFSSQTLHTLFTDFIWAFTVCQSTHVPVL